MKNDPRILVALGTSDHGGPPTVILGLTDATWDDIANGRAHDINLVPLGICAQLLVLRGADHDDIKRQLEEAAGRLDVPLEGLADLSVPKPRSN